VTDAGLVHLRGRPFFFDQLVLSKTAITDAGIKHLQGLRLSTLSLDATTVSDVATAQLQTMTSLRLLSLNNTKATRLGLERLKQAIPKLRIVRLDALTEALVLFDTLAPSELAPETDPKQPKLQMSAGWFKDDGVKVDDVLGEAVYLNLESEGISDKALA